MLGEPDEFQEKKEHGINREDRAIAAVLGVFILICVLAYCAVRILHTETVFFGSCLFHKMTGLYCPGCGATRALLFMLKGDIIKSLIFHPAVFPGACFLLMFIGSNALSVFPGSRIQGMHFRKIYIIMAAAVLILNCIIKNYFLLKGIDLLA